MEVALEAALAVVLIALMVLARCAKPYADGEEARREEALEAAGLARGAPKTKRERVKDACENFIGNPRGPERSELGRINDAKVRGWTAAAAKRFVADALKEVTPAELAGIALSGKDRLFLVHASEDGAEVFRTVDLAMPLSRHAQAAVERCMDADVVATLAVTERMVGGYGALLAKRGELAVREVLLGREATDADFDATLREASE